MTSVKAITCNISHLWFQFLLCSSSWIKTLLAQFTSHASSLLSTQTEILIFPLITYFRYHVTEYCAVIGTHSMVWSDKLLYGHVPVPFPLCGMMSGHARLFRPKAGLPRGGGVKRALYLWNNKWDSNLGLPLVASQVSAFSIVKFLQTLNYAFRLICVLDLWPLNSPFQTIQQNLGRFDIVASGVRPQGNLWAIEPK